MDEPPDALGPSQSRKESESIVELEDDTDVIKNLKSKLITSMNAITLGDGRRAAKCAGFESPEEFEKEMERDTIAFPLFRKMLKLEACIGNELLK